MEVLNDKEKLEIKTSPVRKRPGLWYGVLAVVLIAAIVLAVGYFRSEKKPVAGADGAAAKPDAGSEKAVISVRLLPVQVRPVNMKLLVSGTVWSWDHLTLGSEVGGLKVDGIFVEEGDRVRKGQVLATLQSSILKA
ncbi:MAG: Multidrug resistance protein MdtA [bacterium ADurb.Bin425]|nr:MAG: Multidrug resistance protein MdtA [bacterium ADurb.Bin425]